MNGRVRRLLGRGGTRASRGMLGDEGGRKRLHAALSRVACARMLRHERMHAKVGINLLILLSKYVKVVCN